MAYTTINKSTDYFNTKLYTGNGSTNAITGVGFQPDWIWLKNRDTANSHQLYDAVRGTTKYLESDNNGAEYTSANGISAFGTDGFTINGNLTGANNSGDDFASWNWKAGNSSGSTNNDGSVTSTVSANTTAGFSICKFNYPNSGNFTFGHGLGVAPKMFILKGLGANTNWQMYHGALGNTFNTQLNLTGASNSGANWWGSTSPTSTVCTVGSDLVETGNQGGIAYCFAEKTGYSKFGSYTGNGNADGIFIYTGFKPAFYIIKKTDSSKNWFLHDNKRGGVYNPQSNYVNPNLNEAENSFTGIDILSNGLKLRTSGTGHNQNGASYIFMAFGQSLVGSNNVPCTAR